MKQKWIYSALLAAVCMCTFLLLHASALSQAPGDGAPEWDRSQEAAVNWGVFPPEGGSVRYAVDTTDNCFYFFLKMAVSIEKSTPISAQITLKGAQERWVLDISGTNQPQTLGGIFHTTNLYQISGNSLFFSAAVHLPETGRYEAVLHFWLDGKEIWVQDPIVFNTLPPATTKTETTKTPAKTTAAKASTTKKEETVKRTAEKTTGKKSSAAGSTATKQTDSKDKTSHITNMTEFTDISETINFFQAMSKPARAVFIAAIILSILAILTVGMAIGNRCGRQQKEEETEDNA